MSVLPKRNPVLLACYALALIGMFGFLTWQSLPYDMDGNNYLTGNNEAENPTAETEAQVAPAQTISVSVAQTSPADADTVKEYGRTIGGISTTLYLSKNLEQQINAHWARFAGSALANELPHHQLKVYAVYHQYDASRDSVQLTLGFPDKGDKAYANSVRLAPGRYLKRAQSTVLDSWHHAATLPGQLRYDTDYEIYQLDQNFQPVSHTAFLALQ